MSTKDNKAIIDDMASRMTPLLSLDKNGDNQEDKKNRVFDQIAKQDGHDPEKFREQDIYRSNFMAAALKAHGANAHSFMEQHKDVNTSTATFEMGMSTLELVIEKHKRVPNRVLDGETGNFKVDGERDVYGDSTLKFKVHGAKNSRGDLKAAREELSGLFTNTFGKK